MSFADDFERAQERKETARADADKVARKTVPVGNPSAEEIREWELAKEPVVACLMKGQFQGEHWALQRDGWVVFSSGRWRKHQFKATSEVIERAQAVWTNEQRAHRLAAKRKRLQRAAERIQQAQEARSAASAERRALPVAATGRTREPDTGSFTARSGFWFALFGRDDTVTCGDTDIHLQLQDAKQTISATQLLSPPTYQRGLLWDNLILDTQFGIQRVRGLRSDSSLQSWRGFQARCAVWVGEHVCALKAQLLPALSGTYLRDSQLPAIDARIQSCLDLVGEPSGGFYAALTPEAQQAHDWLVRCYPLEDHKHRLREDFVANKIKQRATFFACAESNPLTHEQSRAVILDDDRNLVLAAAGTGKTSVIVAKTLYMILERMAQPEDILVLAYSRKAREELQERLDQRLSAMHHAMPGQFPTDARPRVCTFHSIGLDILKQTGVIAKLSQFAEHPTSRKRWLTQQLDEYLSGGAEPINQFLGAVYPVCDPFEFETQRDYERFHRDNVYESLNGDKVRSYQELLIGNWLYIQGIDHTYEANYDRTAFASLGYLYRPDFHINGTGIYLEHFGINREGKTRPDIDAEAYNEAMHLKREIHRKHGTILLETFHYEWCEGQLYASLERQLREVGVPLKPRSWPEIHARLNELKRVSQYTEVFDAAIAAVRLERLSHEDILARFEKAQYQNAQYFYPILIHLLDKYLRALRDAGEIDFEDMIIHAIDAVEQGRFAPPWKYLLVDEFQDISQLRMDLLTAIIGKVDHASLYCVGDDWQSIYRFSGGKLELTTRFEQLLGSASTAKLQKTYRYNDSIAKVAGDFMMRNPEQYKKQITTAVSVDSPQVFIMDTRLSEVADQTAEGAMVVSITQKIRENDPQSSIAILARYHRVLDDIRKAFAASKEPEGGLIYWTFHGAKGLEADYCILAGFRQGRHGFPSENRSDAPVEALLPSLDGYAYSEERRLLYVALTRARKRSYIVADSLTPSLFVEELIRGNDVDVRSRKFMKTYRQSYKCPNCADGYLVKRYNHGKDYYTCNGYPGCRTTAKACGSCGSVMAESGLERRCAGQDCSNVEYICPRCGRPLRLRHSRYGQFWGCSGFGAPEHERCSYKTKNPGDIAALQPQRGP